MRIHSLRPAYLTRRIRQIRFEKRNPDAPWLTPSAILLLDGFLKHSDVGLEWGSGHSAAWLSGRSSTPDDVEDEINSGTTLFESVHADGLAKKSTIVLWLANAKRSMNQSSIRMRMSLLIS